MADAVAATHKSQRSVTRLFGQSVDANGVVVGVPVEIRFAHVNVHTKRTKSAAGETLDKPRYDSNILIPKLHSDATQCPNYAAAAAHCMEAAGKAWGSFPQGGKWPIQDGDIPHPQKLKPGQTALTPEQIKARNKWREGSWIVEVTNYMDPGPRCCVFQNGVAVEIPARTVNGVSLYKSGDFGYVSLNAYSFHNKTFGCNFGFEGVLFTRPGDPIGSSGPRSSAAMFGGIAGTVVQPAAPTPGAVQAPGLPPVGLPPNMPHLPAPSGPATVGYTAPQPQAYAAPPTPPAPPAPPAPPLPPAAPMPPGLPAFPIPGR